MYNYLVDPQEKKPQSQTGNVITLSEVTTARTLMDEGRAKEAIDLLIALDDKAREFIAIKNEKQVVKQTHAEHRLNPYVFFHARNFLAQAYLMTGRFIDAQEVLSETKTLFTDDFLWFGKNKMAIIEWHWVKSQLYFVNAFIKEAIDECKNGLNSSLFDADSPDDLVSELRTLLCELYAITGKQEFYEQKSLAEEQNKATKNDENKIKLLIAECFFLALHTPCKNGTLEHLIIEASQKLKALTELRDNQQLDYLEICTTLLWCLHHKITGDVIAFNSTLSIMRKKFQDKKFKTYYFLEILFNMISLEYPEGFDSSNCERLCQWLDFATSNKNIKDLLKRNY